MVLARLISPAFFSWCETTFIGHWIRSAAWGFAVIETVHIVALGMLLGTIVIVDLRLVGLGMPKLAASELSGQLRGWTWTGLILMVLTGTPLFLSEAVRLGGSVPFFYKMAFLLLAIVIHFTIWRRATAVDGPVGTAFSKFAGALSLFCWLGVALAGRAIAFPELLHF